MIDDDVGVAAAMARLLGLHHDVAIETDPAIALARLVGPERFDVVFCDLMMPSGSGIELYEKVAASDPQVAARIVFMTGGVFTRGSRRVSGAGAQRDAHEAVHARGRAGRRDPVDAPRRRE